MKLEIQTNSKQLQTVSDTVEENKKEMKAVKAEIQQIQEGKVQKQKLEITLKHKQELVEQLVQPTNAIFHETRMLEYREKRREATALDWPFGSLKLCFSVEYAIADVSSQWNDFYAGSETSLQRDSPTGGALCTNATALVKNQWETTALVENQ